MTKTLRVMPWGKDNETLGFDVLFLPDGPTLMLSPKQARELRDALSLAMLAAKKKEESGG